MTQSDMAGGQDSFLDIVANLVGILIILVVVVGAQAATVWQKSDAIPEMENRLADTVESTETANLTADNLTLENQELKAKINSEDANIDSLEKRRHWLLMKLDVAKRDAESIKQVQDETQQLRLLKYNEIDRLSAQIEQTRMRANAIASSVIRSKEVIEHYPTPIAKTVFSKEIHFRLLNGRIVHVPLDELIAEMRSEWKLRAEKLQSSNSIVETCGPIGGFRLQYSLEKQIERGQFNDPARTESRFGVQFKKFVVQPTRQNLGEDVDAAISPGSEFFRHLERQPPKKTTVSVWVYPDSYPEFEVLKKWLRQHGFQTASWPLSHGKHIAGGPNGFRTSAN